MTYSAPRDGALTAPRTGTKGSARVTGTAGIEARARALFSDCLEAFQAFGALAELAENLRILSLNAELAAGRAGDKGRAVRALTQYTRELVNRLCQIQVETSGLMTTTYGELGTIVTAIHHLEMIDAAAALAAREDRSAPVLDTLKMARGRLYRPFTEASARMVQDVDRLANRIRVVAEVVGASESIATNIAIEAAAAGQYEADFRTVAETMRRYVLELRKMTDVAGAAVGNALTKGTGLLRAGRDGAADDLAHA